jgi:glycosyltransferase involved in cell wall biosynthesis
MIDGLVSTIIPVYNRPQQLLEAAGSVRTQDYRPIELIIVDDGSTDGETFQAAQTLASQHPGWVHSVTQGNGGPGVARERGRQLAQGEFIQYLDSDDLLLPAKFRLQVQSLRDDPKAGISYGLTHEVNLKTGLTKVTHRTDEVHRKIFPTVLQGRLWPSSTPLYRRDVCDAIGPWAKSRILEDWDYEYRAGVLDISLAYCAEDLALVRYHGGEHAGLAWQRDPRAMRDRAEGYVKAVAYSLKAGIAPESAEMQHLMRSVFWMAREAGAYGLIDEAKALYLLARQHSTGSGLDVAAFGAVARVLGWQRTGRIAKRLDSLKSHWQR